MYKVNDIELNWKFGSVNSDPKGVFFRVSLRFSRESGRLHRGAFVLQQPGGGGESRDAAPHERLSLQERDGNLQLQLLQLHPGRAPQPTGGPRCFISSVQLCQNAS